MSSKCEPNKGFFPAAYSGTGEAETGLLWFQGQSNILPLEALKEANELDFGSSFTRAMRKVMNTLTDVKYKGRRTMAAECTLCMEEIRRKTLLL